MLTWPAFLRNCCRIVAVGVAIYFGIAFAATTNPDFLGIIGGVYALAHMASALIGKVTGG